MNAKKEVKPSLLAELKHSYESAWLRANSKKGRRALFTLFGTFVLVGTFFVHDYFREEARDLRDKLDSSLAETKLKSLIVQNGPAPARAKLLSTSYGSDLPSRVLAMADKMAFAVELTDEGSAQIDVADDLIELLGEHKEYKKYIQLVTDYGNATVGLYECRTDQLRTEVDELQKKITRDSVNSPDLQKAAEALGQKVFDSASCAISARSRAEFLVWRVSAVIGSEVKRAERRHYIFTVASLFLVPFGFILAAIGQLAGLGEIKAE